MKIAFRVDSSYQIGSGHLMRCLTLADRLKEESVDVVFLCREHEGNMSHIVHERGYTVDILPAVSLETKLDRSYQHSHWLGVSLEDDATQTFDRLKLAGPVDWLVVDHYAIDSSWEKQMRSVVGNIMVIDDLADRSHDCDILLDQNLNRSTENLYHELVNNDCQLLCGPEYALLRPQFHKPEYIRWERDGSIKRLLVFFGGVDATGETLKTCRALLSLNNKSITVDVIASASNPQQKQIKQFCEQHSQLNHREYVSDMAEVMSNADLAIGAGGTTTWERCAVGLPSLVISVAENQTPIACEAEKLGISKYLGLADEVTMNQITDAIGQCLKQPEMLTLMSRKALALVDGKGVERVSHLMLESTRVGSL